MKERRKVSGGAVTEMKSKGALDYPPPSASVCGLTGALCGVVFESGLRMCVIYVL